MTIEKTGDGDRGSMMADSISAMDKALDGLANGDVVIGEGEGEGDVLPGSTAPGEGDGEGSVATTAPSTSAPVETPTANPEVEKLLKIVEGLQSQIATLTGNNQQVSEPPVGEAYVDSDYLGDLDPYDST